MQEHIESLLLYLNPVLKTLTICLAKCLFHDFKSVDEIFSLDLPPGEEYELVLSSSTADWPGSLTSEIKKYFKASIHALSVNDSTMYLDLWTDKCVIRSSISLLSNGLTTNFTTFPTIFYYQNLVHFFELLRGLLFAFLASKTSPIHNDQSWGYDEDFHLCSRLTFSHILW